MSSAAKRESRSAPLLSASGSTATPPTEQQKERKKGSPRRRRNHLSCAECRRLKLRCDRVFPCESCRKRGCAAICPEGALTTKGTRFVLANTEELHVKIVDMSERIRQLENALAASDPLEPHPLLREDLLRVKVPVEFSNEAESPPQDPPVKKYTEESGSLPTLLNAFGTLKLGEDGHSRFFGQTARTEHFLKDDDDSIGPELSGSQQLLPPEILHVSQSFPFGSQSQATELMRRILEFLPSYAEAWRLIDNYYDNSAWMYEPCPRPQFNGSVFSHVYEHANDPEGISPHRLALVFATMAHGALMDLSLEPYSPYSAQLHQLARASLAATPFLEEPSLPAIQALFLIGFYWALINKKEAINAGWAVQCLNCKLAEMLGLHRDVEFWDAEDKGAHGEARRKVFWELVVLEGWMSLGLGRPSTVHLAQIDCKFPAATERAMNSSDPSMHDWHTWKHGLAWFVSRVLQKALDAKTPHYSEILELDRSIHEYTMPPDVEAFANGLPVRPPRPEETPGLTMQRSLFMQARGTAVLLLHRGFFAQALSEENDPMQSRFAPSVLATYRSACFIVLALHNVYYSHPALTSRFGLFWSNAFSASIALCLLVTRATRSSYAPFSLGHLDSAYELFSRAASECSPAAKALPIVTRLRDKAHAAYAPYRDGQHPTSLASRKLVDHDDEELKILGGKTNIVSAPLQTPSPPLSSGPEFPQSNSENYPGSPGMPPQMPPMSHLDSVHPSLVQYLAQSRWVSDTNGEHYLEHFNMHTSVPPDSSTQPSLPPQHTGPYTEPEQHYDREAKPEYSTYTLHAANPRTLSSSSIAGALDANYKDAYEPHANDSQGGQPELYQPPQQNQYATWQTYMEQLGLPY